MGSCLSFPSRAKAKPADGTLTQDSSALPSSSSSSLSRISSKNWKEKKKEKKKRKKKKEKKGGGGGGGGLFDRRSVGTSGRILGRVQGEEFDEDKLHLVPGRMFLNGATDVACLFTQQGRKGTNQDAMIVWENFTSRSDTVFCGVFDGHGPFGHMVAKKVRDSLPLKLHTQWKAKAGDQDSPHQNGSVLESMNSEETTSISLHDEWAEPLDVDENEKLPEMYPTLKQSLLKAFKLMDKELKLHPTIDCFCSGTTAVTVVKQGQDLVIGNLGDSRAILGTRDKDNNLVALQLTVDLKPNLPNEAARIQQCKGRVFAMQDEPEVARVWLPNNDSPGLAMARAFGDFCLKDYGLISVPDISYRQLTHRDEFIVLATDGIWDVLSNKEVVDIVASAPTRATAARALIDCAIRAWRLKYPTSKTDDCAVVCLYLDHPPSSDDQPEKSASNTIPTEPGEMMVPGSMDQEANHKEEIHGSVAGGTHIDSSGLEHSHNLRDADEIVPVSESKEEKMPGRSLSTRSLADCISTTEEEEWTALEGVSRANSLLNLPRFLSGDRRSASRRKWL